MLAVTRRPSAPREALTPARVSELRTGQRNHWREAESPAHTQDFRLLAGTPRKELEGKASWEGGILPVGTEVKDSLVMRCGRRLAEGALSKGSRCSKTGTLSWHRGNSHFLLDASLPSASPQGRPQLWGESQVQERYPTALTLAFLPHSGLDLQKWLLPPE